eukprot:4093580-Pyramimonas_sp.AAC.2
MELVGPPGPGGQRGNLGSFFEDCERFGNSFRKSRFLFPLVDHGALHGATLRAVAAAQLSKIRRDRRRSGCVFQIMK